MSESRSLQASAPLSASEREIMSIVQRAGEIARSDIRQRTQLSQQSVHRLIDGLENRGFIHFKAAKIKGRGKPSPRVEIASGSYATLGVSFTTEKVLVCLLDMKGKPLTQKVLDASPNNRSAVMEELRGKIEVWQHGVLGGHTLLGLGIAMQGTRNGTIDRFKPPKPLENWSGIPLIEHFQGYLGYPAFAENNATASATAEHFLGGGAKHDCFAYLSFNFGFGAGFFWHRRPIQGGFGNAGEISSLYSPEESAHRPALGELLKRLNKRRPDIRGLEPLATELQSELDTVEGWIEETGPYLRQAIRALRGLLDPNAIFFGGEAPSELRQMLIAEGQAALSDEEMRCPELIASEIEDDAAHLGAAFLPLHNLVF